MMSTTTDLMVQGNGRMIGEKTPNALRLEAKMRELSRQEEIEQYAPLKKIEMVQDRLPDFPLDCLPAGLRDFVQQLAACKQAPVDAAAVSLLSVFSMAEGGRFMVDPGIAAVYQLGINLFTMTVMESGTGKSEIMNVLKKPIEDFVKDYNWKNREKIAMDENWSSVLRERVSKAKKQCVSGKADYSDLEEAQRELDAFRPMKKLRCITDNATSEALENLLAENDGVMSVVSTEGGVIDIMGGRYSKDGGSNIDIYLHGYSNESFDKDRAGQGHVHVDHLYLNVIFSIQPRVLKDFMRKDFIEKGMTSRFLYSIPRELEERLLRDSPNIEPLVLADYENKIRDIMSIERNVGAPYELRFSREATELMISYNDDEIQKRIKEDLACIKRTARRIIGQTIRLAGVLHLMAYGSEAVEKREISAQTVEKAIRLTNYFLEHTKAAHKTVEDSEEIKNLKYVWEKCRGLKVPEFSSDVLREKCRGRLRTNEEQKPYITGLIERGYLRKLPEDKKNKGKDGRPMAARYRINPLLYKAVLGKKDSVVTKLHPEIPKTLEPAVVS
ncbi:Protein of unknown function [Eubacterium maltosivorans]|uniref:YfjI family protein n=1 Tax=Eubacterium maltosivorans TaxID=2041044 RepID=UPI0008822984|nr:YfjI family protein [Eubacterium maltosivorans]WPK82081.1 hypothetical protein EUMA32_35420 [Eubacterium maltosivorans]SDP65105.1 Protein of unknown function [Eubacterium maltosivorans]